MKTLFSYGGGRQGVAICALIIQGKLPRPDAIVIADTSREKSSTWEYMEIYTQPALREIGLEIEVAPHSLATVDIQSGNGDVLMPLFTSPDGKLPTFCSNEWKKRVCQRWARKRFPGEDIDVWIGFSTDEINRISRSDASWWRYRWPLIEDVRMSSSDCIAEAKRMGWPEPPRSSCWMCPHMSNQEWKGLPEHEFKAAVELERELQQTDSNVWLHRDRVPLSEVDFDAQQDLFDSGCKTGYCFT